MKIRIGFVSNSSSSSYTCDICGCVESGWDMCLSEAEMFECSNGHVFCESHIENVTDEELYVSMLEQGIKKYGNKYEDEDKLNKVNSCVEEERESFCEEQLENTDWRYDYPKKYCPICSLKEINDSELLEYLKYGIGMDIENILEDMRDKFKDYDEFRTFINEKNKK